MQPVDERFEGNIGILPEAPPKPLELRFAGQLVEQLGAQLYPRVTASVAELISNAWDADASNVWINIPFDQKWDDAAVIEVLDDGHGMAYEQAQERYLIVGRNRRREEGESSEGGRALHGRKGIGKLAAFGTAGYLELVTQRNGVTTSFGIDYDKLRRLDPNKPYVAEAVTDPQPLVNPDTGEPLEHGTRVRLSRLRAKRRANQDEFRRSMARRFALNATAMVVHINGDPLTRFHYDVQVRFPRDARPSNAMGLDVDDEGWGSERIDVTQLVDARRERLRQERVENAVAAGQDPEPVRSAEIPTGDLGVPTLLDDNTVLVRWWIGFTEKPIPAEDVRGVSILARGKLAQRPFMFEMAQGTEGQLLQEYLVGEVEADWLDFGRDADDDLIQSNRDQLQLDNEELQPLLAWGRERLRWAMAEQGRRRRERRAGPEALGDDVEQVIQKAPSKARDRFRTLAARIADLTDDNASVARAMDAVIGASEVGQAEKARAELALEGDPDDAATWELLKASADATIDVNTSLLEARLYALERFREAISEPPVETLHARVVSDPWIISPVFGLVTRRDLHQSDEVTVVEFAGLEPFVQQWTLVCFAVDSDVGELPSNVNGNSVVVGCTNAEVGAVNLTWSEALAESEAAHRMLLDALDAE